MIKPIPNTAVTHSLLFRKRHGSKCVSGGALRNVRYLSDVGGTDGFGWRSLAKHLLQHGDPHTVPRGLLDHTTLSTPG